MITTPPPDLTFTTVTTCGGDLTVAPAPHGAGTLAWGILTLRGKRVHVHAHQPPTGPLRLLVSESHVVDGQPVGHPLPWGFRRKAAQLVGEALHSLTVDGKEEN